ncbi:MAG: Dihydropteroate synthase [Actinobacteria bacterium]|nr:Dihydropteroate synthase [Actinomycetota bacterium]
MFSVSSAEQVDAWMKESPKALSALSPVSEAIGRYLSRDFVVECRGRKIRLSGSAPGGSPRIMGILNVTPDSFSDGGRFHSTEAAVRHGIAMAEEGADIIDVGGESTRPGSSPVSVDEEIGRVVPVIRELSRKTDALLSVDTTKAAVARNAVAAGACIINDTSALTDDPEMAEFAAESGCAVVLMHRRGTPSTMQASPSYGSLFDELLEELAARVEAAIRSGVSRERILVDPGIGFGKRLEDNLALHRHLPDLRNLGRPVVFGTSRKSFIGKITGKDPGDRVFGTAASVAVSAFLGADVLRVHDVPEMRDVVRVVAAIRDGSEC